jgi:transglutaminase-like putative cysteine protease
MTILLAFATLSGLVAAAAETPTLDPNQPYSAERSNPVGYDVDYSVVITPPYRTRTLKVWLPIPPTDGAQQVTGSELTSFPIDVKPRIAQEPVFGNQFAYFEFDHPEGAQIIRHKFKIKLWELRWNLDPAKVTNVTAWPARFDRYLHSEQQAVVVNDRIQALVGEAVPERRGPADDLASIIAWVNKRMKYDHKVASLEASALHALDTGRGHCSDYHGLAGIARWRWWPGRLPVRWWWIRRRSTLLSRTIHDQRLDDTGRATESPCLRHAKAYDQIGSARLSQFRLNCVHPI